MHRCQESKPKRVDPSPLETRLIGYSQAQRCGWQGELFPSLTHIGIAVGEEARPMPRQQVFVSHLNGPETSTVLVSHRRAFWGRAKDHAETRHDRFRSWVDRLDRCSCRSVRCSGSGPPNSRQAAAYDHHGPHASPCVVFGRGLTHRCHLPHTTYTTHRQGGWPPCGRLTCTTRMTRSTRMPTT